MEYHLTIQTGRSWLRNSAACLFHPFNPWYLCSVGFTKRPHSVMEFRICKTRMKLGTQVCPVLFILFVVVLYHFVRNHSLLEPHSGSITAMLLLLVQLYLYILFRLSTSIKKIDQCMITRDIGLPDRCWDSAQTGVSGISTKPCVDYRRSRYDV